MKKENYLLNNEQIKIIERLLKKEKLVQLGFNKKNQKIIIKEVTTKIIDSKINGEMKVLKNED